MSQTAAKLSPKGEMVYMAVWTRAVRMLKAVSLGGATATCTATAATLALQMPGEAAGLGAAAMIAASAASLTSTLGVNYALRSFVTQITVQPPDRAAGGQQQVPRQGLRSFDSIVEEKTAGAVGSDTRLQIETVGILGLTTRVANVRVGDLGPSGGRLRRWILTPQALREREQRGQPTPVRAFTVLWGQPRNMINRKVLEEVNNVIGS